MSLDSSTTTSIVDVSILYHGSLPQLIPGIDTIMCTDRQLGRIHNLGHVILVKLVKGPPAAEAALVVSRGFSSISIVVDPFAVSSAAIEMILVGLSIETAVHICFDEVFLVGPKRSTELGEVPEEDTFERLAILTALTTVVAVFFENSAATQSMPCFAFGGPTCGPDNIFDKGVAILEIAASTGGHPQAATGRENHTLVVGEDHRVNLITFACTRIDSAVTKALPAFDVEAIAVETSLIGHL